MDTIWNSNPSKMEFIGFCGGNEKTNDHTEPKQLNAKRYNKIPCIYL